jgi:hypothetical protein
MNLLEKLSNGGKIQIAKVAVCFEDLTKMEIPFEI